MDDQGRLVEYGLDSSAALRQARFAEAYTGQTLTSYCQTDYTAETPPNQPTVRRGTVAQVRNTYWWKDNGGTWQSSLLTQNDYLYDPAGFRTSNTITIPSANVARTEAYAYDYASRLATVQYEAGQTPLHQQDYTFDAMGNRLTRTGEGGNQTCGFDAAGIMLTSVNGQAYTNDLNGNQITGAGRTNTWDSQNRLVQCVYGNTTSQFTYGPDGLRRCSTVNGVVTNYVLDNSMMVRETNNGGFAQATYLIGPRGPEYRRTDVGTPQTVAWYCYDGLGSVLAEVDVNGTVSGARTYDAYGGLHSGGSGTSKHGYVGSLGHATEPDTGGLVYMQARWMDPACGRFVSEDPVRQGVNWFTYCGGNPVNAVDPSGLEYTLSGLMSSLFGWTCIINLVKGFVKGFLTAAFGSWMTTGHVNWGLACVSGGVAGLIEWISGGVADFVKEAARISGQTVELQGAGRAVAALEGENARLEVWATLDDWESYCRNPPGGYY